MVLKTSTIGDKIKSTTSYRAKPREITAGAAKTARTTNAMIMGAVKVRKLKAMGKDSRTKRGILNDIKPRVKGIEHNRNSLKWMAK